LLRKDQFRFAGKEPLGKRNAARWKESKAPKNIGGRRAAFGRIRGSLTLGSDARRNVRRSDAPKSIDGSDATFGGTQGLLRGEKRRCAL